MKVGQWVRDQIRKCPLWLKSVTPRQERTLMEGPKEKRGPEERNENSLRS